MRLATVSSILGLSMVAAAMATSVSAQASSTYLTDSRYIGAARCAGLAKGLGSDATGFDKVVSDQEGARSNYIVDTAQQAREDAERAAKTAGPDRKAQLAAERDNSCKAYLGQS